MDNLSHSVVGLAAGEFLHRTLPPESDVKRHALRRRLLLVGCWLASNFPDLDLVLTPLLPTPLGYLLHHRGHTHTLLYAIPQALLLWGLLWLLWPGARHLLRTSVSARKGLAAALGAGLLLHLLMDFLNSYGIHPFHPFDSHWYYGDMVFILEPAFWVMFGAPMAMTVRARWLRAVLLGLLLALPLFFTVQGYLSWPSWFVLSATGIVLTAMQLKSGMRGRAALATSAALILVFIVGQDLASQRARMLVTQSLHGIDPDSRVLDVALTAFPSNPACWMFASVESNEAADRYRLRRGVLSIVPRWLPLAQCPRQFAKEAAAQAATHASAPGIGWTGEESGSLRTLRELRLRNCYFDAWLRFARMPALDAGTATDERFAPSPRGNFTALRLDAFRQRACPRYVPQWDYPRADLLADH